MKLINILAVDILFISECKSEQKQQPADKISPQKLCNAFDLKIAESLVHKKPKTTAIGANIKF